MNTETPRAQPKGGMCMACEKRERDCSALPFAGMHVIERGPGGLIVRCTEFLRAPVDTAETPLTLASHVPTTA